MKAIQRRWISNGLAMFSMFFGAGNVIFPLIVGFETQASVFYAIIGLFITAVLVPFSGLIATTLFDGNYLSFFNRLGKVPGAFIATFVLALIGPFGGIPRCVTLTYSTFKVYFPGLSLAIFSLSFLAIVFLFCFKQNKVLDLLGYVLTPFLILFLAIVVIKGIVSGQFSVEEPFSKMKAVLYGLHQGYFTMDLLAAFFFSSIVCEQLKSEASHTTHKQLVIHLLKASSIGAGLLLLVYTGFAIVSSIYSTDLISVPSDHLLGAIGKVVLGPYAGFIVSIVVALSCLTTAIALVLVSAEFLERYILKSKVSYLISLSVIIVLSWLVSMLEFSGIVRFLSPILTLAYPSFLLLSFLNICYKLFGFKPVKIPVLILFLATLIRFLFFR